jgi:hypothetical protein
VIEQPAELAGCGTKLWMGLLTKQPSILGMRAAMDSSVRHSSPSHTGRRVSLVLSYAIPNDGGKHAVRNCWKIGVSKAIPARDLLSLESVR